MEKVEREKKLQRERVEKFNEKKIELKSHKRCVRTSAFLWIFRKYHRFLMQTFIQTPVCVKQMDRISDVQPSHFICLHSHLYQFQYLNHKRSKTAHRQYRNFLMTTNATNAVKLFTLQFNGHCTICTPPTQMDKK